MFHYHVGQHLVGIVLAVDGVVDELQVLAPAAGFQGVHHAEVLQGCARREDVEVGHGQLREGQLVGFLTVLLYEALHVAECFHTERFEYRQVGHQRHGEYLCLVHGGDAFVQSVEGVHVDETAERFGREGHVVKSAALHQSLYLPPVVGDGGAQTTELVVGQFQHTGQSAELSAEIWWEFHVAFVADVVLDGRPHVLQGGAHLQFKAGTARFQAADIVQRVVAEGVQLVFALVDAFLPVDVEDALGDGSHGCPPGRSRRR